MAALASLMFLALVDAGFAGFRTAAGRDARLRKWASAYYPRAIGRGLALGAAMLLVSALAWALLRPSFAVLSDIARPMLAVLASYTTVVLVAFLPWRLAGVELRTLISVMVFGPLTLVRPLVVLGALLFAAFSSTPDPRALLVLSIGAACAMLVEPVLNAQARRDARSRRRDTRSRG